MIRPQPLVVLLIIISLGLIPRISAAAQFTNVFEKDILAFEAADRANPPPAGALLLVGDSQFTRWKTVHQDLPEYRIINRGFGGSKMTDLLLYTGRIVLRYQPRMIVVNEGGNDIHSGRTPEQLLADITTFVNRVRAVLPDAPIIFSGLTPSPARWSETDTRLRFNRMLREYFASGKNLIYLDLFDGYLGPDGKPREELFVEDKLHHSAAGYAVRVRIMRPFLGPPDFPDRKPSR
jgi:lysophospholipase L1-like esterase